MIINASRKLFRLYKHRKCMFFISNQIKYSTCAILGIETSCDDTGCAVIDGSGNILGEELKSQHLMHLRHGGIIPDVAQDLHRKNIESVVSTTLERAKMTMENITAIAVTLEPGLALSLVIGMKYAKHLSRKYNKPIIPIHHMEAHALAVRLNEDIQFPYLVLLVSGGHCLIAVVEDVNKFSLLGESIDCAPGEIFDKVARRMKLRNKAEYSNVCGGQAIEMAAMQAKNSNVFKFHLPLADLKDCNFSFSGVKSTALYHIYQKEKLHGIVADEIIPEANDLCLELLKTVSRHLVHRTQRAVEFCDINNLIPEGDRKLVVSGGVACNNYIYNALAKMCKELDYKIYRPSPKLCTDNGVMIAWNGLEKWRRGLDIVTDLNSLDIKANSPLGKTLIPEVIKSNIPVKLIKLKL